MERDIKQWQVENVSQGGLPLSLSSISQAIEVLVEVSKKETGETLDFLHADRGAIICTAGKGRSTLTFVPDYNKHKHSLAGSRSVRSSNGSKGLLHVDSIGSVSTIPANALLPVLDVVRALVYIFEKHDVPPFLDWTGPAVEC
jgi:hypothetical protein